MTSLAESTSQSSAADAGDAGSSRGGCEPEPPPRSAPGREDRGIWEQAAVGIAQVDSMGDSCG